MEEHLFFEMEERKKIHLGITGSISAYKAVEIMRAWQKVGIDVSVTLTESAKKFISPLTFESLGAYPVYSGMFDRECGDILGSATAYPITHLAPSKDADAFIIAPASADTIAQLAVGRADTLLSAQALAYTKQILFAPAMNPNMWENQATQDNVRLLEDRGLLCIYPEHGKVACNDTGRGRLASLEQIYLYGLKAITEQDLKDRTVLITAGATREPFDDIRYWTNSSTGKMGMSFAIAAWLRGADVHLVCGEGVNFSYPKDAAFTKHTVKTAQEMFHACLNVWEKCDYGIFTAAVADFRPELYGEGKFKKSHAENGFSLKFYTNQDILKTLADSKSSEQKILGFAAEYALSEQELERLALKKMYAKDMDMIVANTLDSFGSERSKVFVADRQNREEHWEELPKTQIAWNLLTWLTVL